VQLVGDVPGQEFLLAIDGMIGDMGRHVTQIDLRPTWVRAPAQGFALLAALFAAQMPFYRKDSGLVVGLLSDIFADPL
jgi:hypothetical protein